MATYWNSRCPYCKQEAHQSHGYGYCYDCDKDYRHCACGRTYHTTEEWVRCEDNQHDGVLGQIVRALDEI